METVTMGAAQEILRREGWSLSDIEGAIDSLIDAGIEEWGFLTEIEMDVVRTQLGGADLYALADLSECSPHEADGVIRGRLRITEPYLDEDCTLKSSTRDAFWAWFHQPRELVLLDRDEEDEAYTRELRRECATRTHVVAGAFRHEEDACFWVDGKTLQPIEGSMPEDRAGLLAAWVTDPQRGIV